MGEGRQRVVSGSPFESLYGFCRAVRVGERVVVGGTCRWMGVSVGWPSARSGLRWNVGIERGAIFGWAQAAVAAA
jgi:hypothetical protein